MANKNPKFEAFVSPVGEAVFPSLIKPDTRFDANGTYRVDLAYTVEGAQPFTTRLENSLERFFKEELNTTQQKTLARKPVWIPEYTRPEYPEGATDEEKAEIKAAFIPEETGRIMFRFKMNAKFKNKKGEVITQQPVVVDATSGERITEDLWNGSKLRVKGQIVPYVNAAAQVAGLSLRLKAAQVFEAVLGGDGGSFWTDFESDDSE